MFLIRFINNINHCLKNTKFFNLVKRYHYDVWFQWVSMERRNFLRVLSTLVELSNNHLLCPDITQCETVHGFSSSISRNFSSQFWTYWTSFWPGLKKAAWEKWGVPNDVNWITDREKRYQYDRVESNQKAQVFRKLTWVKIVTII